MKEQYQTIGTSQKLQFLTSSSSFLLTSLMVLDGEMTHFPNYNSILDGDEM
jgi:hypothetical protein